MTPVRTAWISFFAAILLWPIASLAEAGENAGPAGVLVRAADCCGDKSWPAAEERIIREFALADVSLKIEDSVAADSAAGLTELSVVADRFGVPAAMRVLKTPEGGSIDIFVRDPVSGKTTLRHLPFRIEAQEDGAEICGLRAIEIFQASMMEFHIALSGAAIPVPQAAVETQKEEPPPPARNFAIGVGFAGIFSGNDVGPRGAPVMALLGSPLPHLVLGVEGEVSVVGEDIVQEESGASFQLASLLARVYWDILTEGWFRPSIGVYAGATWMWTTGWSDGDAPTGTRHMVSANLGGGARFNFVLSPLVQLFAGGDMGVLLPQAQIEFGGDVVARFGAPIFRVAGGIAFYWRLENQ